MPPHDGLRNEVVQSLPDELRSGKGLAFRGPEADEARHVGDEAADGRDLSGRRESAAVLPSRSNRKVVREHDRVIYGWRHQIENFFARIKEFRAIAARYDKTAASVRATFLLAAAVIAAR